MFIQGKPFQRTVLPPGPVVQQTYNTLNCKTEKKVHREIIFRVDYKKFYENACLSVLSDPELFYLLFTRGFILTTRLFPNRLYK